MGRIHAIAVIAAAILAAFALAACGGDGGSEDEDQITEAIEKQEIETCVRQRIEEVSDEQLQATFLENDDTVFERSLAPCFEGQQG